ncbi:response regulator transcription factor [Eggerthella sinensis]|jgi:DNA-binding response OmpR family regulator|uniref:DNA-binding response regulator n=1 Tax=Eggerthella sinensis TaxID=242230 RepID=A0A3N0IYS4_9ACTN|nr:response regulator transcription factor [Eggerthella sinensis]MCB7036436.1 response regulator transcription factor [Eggerthella sinensis]RDB66745.1 DNA-binding response regulator [Eggerthella sinensis]RNM42143.1 DNA-binding response regulator [Eggerthella sinensis]
MTSAAKVMLIDDDESLHVLMKRIVEEAGYEFCAAFSGAEGLALLGDEHPDLLLLDVMMPGMNGFDVCRTMRESGRRIPIIFLSAKGDIVDKSIGFKAGGDDYVVKPFSSDELLLRIEAHLRRHREDLTFAKAVSREGCNHTGDLEILFNQYEVRLRGVTVDLTAKEFEILALLAASPGQVFTRNQIYEHIWGLESEVDESSITVFMRKIREKIEDNPSQPKYLLTVWRVGYKFAERV